MRRTKKQIPPVESGKFKIVPPMSIRTGDVIYLPNYLSASPSTLRSAGLSIGHTCRSNNKEELVEKVFGPGHQTMFLIVMNAERTKIQRTRRTTLALPESFDNTAENAPRQTGEDPGVLTSIDLMAVPRGSFDKNSVEASIEMSQMFSADEWKNRLVSTLTSRVKDRLDELFVTQRRIDRGTSLEDRTDVATWLMDAVLEHAENTTGGVTASAVARDWAGEVFRQDDMPSWMMNNVNVAEKSASALSRARYEFLQNVHDPWKTDNINVRFHAQKFLLYITGRGCAVLRRADGKSILDVMDAQIVKETAAKMAARIQAVAAVFANVLAPALDNATTAMYEMAGRWAAIRNDVDDEWTAVAETMSATEPGIKYGYGRRKP